MSVRQSSLSHNQRGFTLLETLASLVIMSIIMAVIVGIFSGSLAIFKNRSRIHTSFMEFARFENRLRADLQDGITQLRVNGDGWEISGRDRLVKYRITSQGVMRDFAGRQTLFFGEKDIEVVAVKKEGYNRKTEVLEVFLKGPEKGSAIPEMIKLRVNLQ